MKKIYICLILAVGVLAIMPTILNGQEKDENRKEFYLAKQEGKIVISDRYADATSAYQGAGRGFPVQIIDQVIKIATDGLKPDLTLFFDLPVEKALARTKSDSDPTRTNNRMDSERSDFYKRVRNAYLELAEKERKRFRIIDADNSIEEIHKKVVETVINFLEK